MKFQLQLFIAEKLREKMMMTHIFQYLTGNNFALIHVSMTRMRNKIKTKASLFKQYLLCLVLYRKVAAKTIANYVFCSLKISGARKW